MLLGSHEKLLQTLEETVMAMQVPKEEHPQPDVRMNALPLASNAQPTPQHISLQNASRLPGRPPPPRERPSDREKRLTDEWKARDRPLCHAVLASGRVCGIKHAQELHHKKAETQAQPNAQHRAETGTDLQAALQSQPDPQAMAARQSQADREAHTAHLANAARPANADRPSKAARKARGAAEMDSALEPPFEPAPKRLKKEARKAQTNQQLEVQDAAPDQMFVTTASREENGESRGTGGQDGDPGQQPQSVGQVPSFAPPTKCLRCGGNRDVWHVCPLPPTGQDFVNWWSRRGGADQHFERQDAPPDQMVVATANGEENSQIRGAGGEVGDSSQQPQSVGQDDSVAPKPSESGQDGGVGQSEDAAGRDGRFEPGHRFAGLDKVSAKRRRAFDLFLEKAEDDMEIEDAVDWYREARKEQR